jgi:hypothetical protein
MSHCLLPTLVKHFPFLLACVSFAEQDSMDGYSKALHLAACNIAFCLLRKHHPDRSQKDRAWLFANDFHSPCDGYLIWP